MVRLDHVGLVVPRLDEAARLFRALGFTLTERAEHTRTNEAGETIPAGSAQHSVMLERGYIELQEITDPEGRHLLSPAAAKHFGLHIVAFGVEDAEDAHARVEANGLEVGPVLRWGRAIAEPDRQGEALFAFFVAPYDPADEALLCWTEHLTPDLVRSPRLLDHANGARSLGGIVIAARDVAEAERLAGRYAASGGERDGSDVSLGDALIRIAGGAPLRGPDRPAAPVVSGLVLRLPDPEALAGRAEAEGLELRREGGRTLVELPAEYNLTLILEKV